MANCCTYDVHIRGTKKSALMVYSTLPVLDYKQINLERGTDDCYVIHASGCCKWSLDYYCENDYSGETPNLDIFTEDQIRNCMFDETNVPYFNTSLQIKSKILNCEIEAHSWSEESQFDTFESYKNGAIIARDSIDFCDEHLEWDKDEYPDYEEFCEDYGIDPEMFPESAFEYIGDNVYEYIPTGENELKFSFSF